MDTQRKIALKTDYKLNPPEAGVYKIENRATGRVFVESSVNLKGIFNRRRMELRSGGCWVRELQNDWRQYGEDQFTFEVLEALEPRAGDAAVHPDDLQTCLAMWLDELQPYGARGYNKPPEPAQ